MRRKSLSEQILNIVFASGAIVECKCMALLSCDNYYKFGIIKVRSTFFCTIFFVRLSDDEYIDFVANFLRPTAIEWVSEHEI
jgi:hypothetical protein